jgi:hypothetical protein
MRFLYALLLLAVAHPLHAQTRPCDNIKWKTSDEKSRDSSFGQYYYDVGNEGLSNRVQGLTSLTFALKSETQTNVDYLCFIVGLQEDEITTLQAELAELKKQIERKIPQTKKTKDSE